MTPDHKPLADRCENAASDDALQIGEAWVLLGEAADELRRLAGAEAERDRLAEVLHLTLTALGRSQPVWECNCIGSKKHWPSCSVEQHNEAIRKGKEAISATRKK